jgi:deoxyribonuclease-4
MRFGFHISISRGFENVIARAKYLGCETVQIFTGSNKQWKRTPFDQDKVESFRKLRKTSSLDPLIVHLFYLPNLATPDREMLERSRQALLTELERSSILGAEFLVLHPGAFKQTTPEQGLKTVAASLDYVIAKAAGNGTDKIKILIENTSGGGTRIGAEFTELAEIFDFLKQTYPVGICLDTAHAFQAGYPIHTPEGLERTLEEFDRLIGLDKLLLLHLNDSKTRLGSHNDRHWHIGKGEIGLDAFRRIINHPRLKHLPAIMETPTAETHDLRNMATVKKLRAEG